MYIHPLFSSLPIRAREALVKVIELRTLRKHQCLLEVGEKINSMYCVASGLLQVVLPGPHGSTIATNFLSPDDIHLDGVISETEVFSDVRLVAVLPSTVYVMPLWALRRVSDSYPAVSAAMLKIQTHQIQMLRRQLRRRGTLSAEHLIGRILQELTRFAPRGSQAFDRQITQRDIAAYAGLSRPVVNKVLKELEERGAVRRSKEAIYVGLDDSYKTNFQPPISF